MIKEGDRAKIVISPSLIDMQLIPLVSRWGTVVGTVKNKRNPGVWLKLDKEYKKEEFWFIPIKSIRTPMNKTVVEKKRNGNLLNTIKI